MKRGAIRGQTAGYESRRLRDRVAPEVRVLLVGINPGVRSALLGRHFAGYSNRFWKLLHEAGLTPVLLTAEQDHLLPQWGFGITNLIARPTPGIDTLRTDEYVEGLRILRRKIKRWKPDVVAFIGVTLFRAIFGKRAGEPVTLGEQVDTFEGARVFVLPNPSGRNANFSYAEMLTAFATLRPFAAQRPSVGPSTNATARDVMPHARDHRRRTRSGSE
jgi:TDG/mug DNA glycosylase family protein